MHFVSFLSQVRDEWTNWAVCSSTADHCRTTSDWRSSNWQLLASVRASSRANCACRTAASQRSSTDTKRRAASAPESSVAPDPSPVSSQTSSAVFRPIAWRITASSLGKSETGKHCLQQLNCMLTFQISLINFFSMYQIDWSKRVCAINRLPHRWAPFRATCATPQTKPMPPQPPKLNRHQVKKEKENPFSFEHLKKSNLLSFLSLMKISFSINHLGVFLRKRWRLVDFDLSKCGAFVNGQRETEKK